MKQIYLVSNFSKGKTMNKNQIVSGSIGAIAQQSGKSIAESFISADIIVIVDTSGSMNARDSRGDKSRYDVACEELAGLQNSLPGKIAVISFSDDAVFCPSGVPLMLGAMTDLVKALQFAKVADIPDMRFILISDGEPNDPNAALAVAKTYKNKIDVIYVGPESYPIGREFLQKLAAATGGLSVTADRAAELQAGVMQLLGAGK
jgi:hypothetical protein